MTELEEIKEKLTPAARRVLDAAIEESKNRQHYYLGVEHLFLAFAKVEENFFREVMEDLNLDIFHVINFLNEHLNVSRQYIGLGLKIPPATRNVFRLAREEAQRWGRDELDSTDLFIAIFQENHSLPAKVFRSFGLDPDYVMRRITVKVRSKEEMEEELKKKYELPPNLKHFAVNLNKLARFDKLPVIIGRDSEIDQVMEILCHMERSNSVMIIGEPGVGKTAVVEGLARRIELEPKRVPKRLRDKQIVNLQMNSVVAGTIFRGMFEDRIEKIIKEIKERKNIIFFIDEAHTLIGAGSAMGVPSDAANIFKSTLSRGEVQIIGATTLSEYKEFIAEDEALARRFRLVHIQEPTVEETRKILYGIRPRLEKSYSVKVMDEAIETGLDMSQRYMRSLKMPDKVIGWLDTSCVKVEINRPSEPVGPDDIIEVISQETRIPRDMIFRDTVGRFKDMEKTLARRVVGQKEAINALSKRLRLNKGPLKENFARPDGVLLFLGPTGVGKTELAKSLADFLFGDEKKMIRLDMSEYKDSGVAVDKLIGMPRGIVGSERGGLLTNPVRENPYSVVLLDEVEKAHPFVLNLFLQVFDEGWLTDGRGKRVYFSDTVIIMTSNLGADVFRKYVKPLGFMTENDVDARSYKKDIIKEVENTLSPEFLNRIDDVIVFTPLTRNEVRQLTLMYLEKIREHMEGYGKHLSVTEKAIDVLVDKGYNQRYGARFLKRHVDEKVKVPITLKWKEGDFFKVDAEREEVTVEASNMGEPALA
ncbi:MAG: ATP-dependent Clp protease ATP-binding subunit [Deltaproteobacteria bacterium]|nr:ATP-dependent Clp protease ATP-binding subunit [Deltaproteobacteria bacterium]MCL4873805.1 ATP-dependent Clp protease ATP-binding subunit [bacterium]